MKKKFHQKESVWNTLLLSSYCILSFLIGLGNTIKSGICSELSVHSNLGVACFVAMSGALIVLGVYDTWKHLRYGPLEEIPTWREGFSSANSWELIGGFLGFLAFSFQIFGIYYLGATLMKVLLCLAEVITSVGIDMATGLYSGRGKMFPVMIALSVFFLLTGAGIVLHENGGSPRLNKSFKVKWIACVAPLITGFLGPVQARINTSLSRKLQSKIRAAKWSFGTGIFFYMGAAIANVYAAPGSWDLFLDTLHDPSNWWMFTAGPPTFCAIYGAIALPPLITLGSHYICMTSGQLTMALYLDTVGAFTFEPKPATTARVVGTLAAIVGAVFSRLPFMLESSCTKDLQKEVKYFVL